MTKVLTIVGSNSIHCKRFIAKIYQSKKFNLSIITNQFIDEFKHIRQEIVNFALLNMKAVKQINQFLEQVAPEVIHIHQVNSYAYHSIRAIKKLNYKPKIILTAWGSDILILPYKNKFFNYIVKYSLSNADIITSDSLYMSAEIAKLLEKTIKPIHTINFGMQNFPEQNLISQKQNIILSSRLHKPLYQIAAIIKAFATLILQNKIDNNYKLIIAASGEETSRLKKLANQLGIQAIVQFTGMLNYHDLCQIYKRAKIFVSVPTSDATASSLLEAMAYGCIPVLSNLPANLEWVIDELNGHISPTIEALSFNMHKAILTANNLTDYQRLISFNYKLIKQKALFNNNIQKFIELY